jgi:hypothetical protein
MSYDDRVNCCPLLSSKWPLNPVASAVPVHIALQKASWVKHAWNNEYTQNPANEGGLCRHCDVQEIQRDILCTETKRWIVGKINRNQQVLGRTDSLLFRCWNLITFYASRTTIQYVHGMRCAHVATHCTAAKPSSEQILRSRHHLTPLIHILNIFTLSNPILFATCSSTFSKLCINVCCGL